MFSLAGAANLVRGQVFAFEPDQLTRTRLEANIRLNGFENIHVIPWAVSDREGEVVLYTGGPSGYAAALAHQGHPDVSRKEMTVRTRTLDQVVSAGDLPAPSIIKLDVEGAEGLCLRGAWKLLQGAFGERPREIFVELHPDLLAGFQTSAPAVQADLVYLGYEPIWSMERSSQVHIHYIDPAAAK